MPVNKYNFDEIKQEYFESPIIDAKGYMEDRFGKWNGNFADNTTGWRIEKDEYIKEQVESANRKYAKEREQKWIKVLKNIDTARMAGLQDLGSRLVNQDKISKLQVREVIDALKHMRLELGETTENIESSGAENPMGNKLKELGLE